MCVVHKRNGMLCAMNLKEKEKKGEGRIAAYDEAGGCVCVQRAKVLVLLSFRAGFFLSHHWHYGSLAYRRVERV